MVFSFTTLCATDLDRVNLITPSTCLSRRAHSSAIIVSGFSHGSGRCILDLHPPKSKVCAIELFYSRCISCVLCHCFHSNLTLGSDTSCRELTWNSQPVRSKNRENTRQRKIITCTKQYLRGLAICLHPRSCRDFIIIKEKNTKRGCIVFLSLKNYIKKP